MYGDINPGYSYLSYSASNMYLDVPEESVFKSSVTPAALSDMLNGGTGASKLSDRSFGNRLLQSFAKYSDYGGSYTELVNSALTMDAKTYKNQGQSVNTIFRIHNTKELLALDDYGIGAKEFYDRVKTGEYPVSCNTWKNTFRCIVSAFVPGGEYLFDIVEGSIKGNLDMAKILGNMLSDLTGLGGAINFFKTAQNTFDPEAKFRKG